MAVLCLLIIGGIVALVTGGASPMTISARFATAPGLYPGNSVDILGMPVGKVTEVTPGPSSVTVVMQVPAGTPIPAGAEALLMAPQVVNDRYVQLNPAYNGGQRMQDGAVIPTSRTAVPISVDEIVDSLDQLAVALGPNGANAHGALSDFVASSAHAFGGDGAALHSTLISLGRPSTRSRPRAHALLMEGTARTLTATLHHRTEGFRKLLKETLENLRYYYNTKNDVLIFSSSGTGAMEGAVSNLLSPGDRVLIGTAGKFGERWGQLAKAYGIDAVTVEVPYGQTLPIAEMTAKLKSDGLDLGSAAAAFLLLQRLV